ncbi:hypothetical protein BU16DRAFT_620095 [Lophium mytilinum]|uniref:Yeast cell wall synthesis Kre9/Knh1-like N-terminal domain-containing protein n=1 Tax=Lophium mytilinum TaxID=390894 RepID=A0A6A6QL22_9PEZI|nr:hypothetical protein BU16DRAFT_620095 [Lophium mytilinum]
MLLFRPSFASKHFLISLFIWSYATTCTATLAFTSSPSTIAAGSSTVLEWTTDGSSDPVTIELLKGPASDLTPITTIISKTSNTVYTWTVPSSLDAGTDYVLQLSQANIINYGPQFAITGGTVASSAASTASSAAATVIAISSATPVAASSSTPEPSSTPTPSSIAQVSSAPSSAPAESSSRPSSAISTATPSSASAGSISSTSTSLASTSAPSTPSQSSTPTSSSTATSKAASTGLTTGAKAGIGVAVPLGVIAIALGAFFLGRRRNTTKPAPSGEEGYTARHELEGKGVPPAELPVSQWDERGGYWRTQPTAPAAELPTRDNKHELAAREVGREG